MVASTTPTSVEGATALPGRMVECRGLWPAGTAAAEISLPRVIAEQGTRHGHKIVDVVGVRTITGRRGRAIEAAASLLRDLRVAEVTKMDMKVENGKVAAFRTRVSLSRYGG